MLTTMRALRRKLLGVIAEDEDGSDESSSVDDLRRGFYAPFDMARDHTGPVGEPWYRAPGQPSGENGDPYRDPDPYAQLGFHPSQDVATTTGAMDAGEEGSEHEPSEEEEASAGDTTELDPE